MKKLLSLLVCMCLIGTLTVGAAAAQMPLVNDFAGLLTESEIETLTEMAEAIGSKYQMDAVVLTVDSLEGKDAQSYADDYYDYNGYGADGVLMLLAMEEREYYISTKGDAIYALTDYVLYQMEEEFLNALSNGDYFDAFHSYLWDVDYYVNEFHENGAVDGYVPEEDRYTNHTDVVYSEDLEDLTYADLAGAAWIISIGFGLVVGGIGLLILRIGMNTKKRQHSAGDYIQSGSFDLTQRQDIFLYSRVTKTRKPEPSSSGGGSGVHTSRSGSSHGGRGGKF